nr:MAG TPA: hypothetical protein [Caudoviricetes sp.]
MFKSSINRSSSFTVIIGRFSYSYLIFVEIYPISLYFC